MQTPLARRSIAEMIGTFCLVLIGCGAMAVESRTATLTHVGVAISWGLVVMTMIYAIGDISGAHINPAVSLAFAAVGRLGWGDAAVYVASQSVGGLAAAAAIRGTLGVDDAMLGATMVTDVPLSAGFLIELMMTAILMFIIMGVSTGAKEKTITAGLAVGSTIAMEAMVAGPLTKASMNPARSLGPGLVSGAVDQLWLYLTAPVVGALVGAVAYVLIRPAAAVDIPADKS